MSEPEGLAVYVIYKNPRDYPGKWVCRRQVATRAGDVVADPEPFAVVPVTHSLAPLRGRLVYMGLTRMERHPADDAVIVETWI